MKFLAGFAIGFVGGLFGVWYAAAHAGAGAETDEWRGRVYTLRPNGWDYYTEVSS